MCCITLKLSVDGKLFAKEEVVHCLPFRCSLLLLMIALEGANPTVASTPLSPVLEIKVTPRLQRLATRSCGGLPNSGATSHQFEFITPRFSLHLFKQLYWNLYFFFASFHAFWVLDQIKLSPAHCSLRGRVHRGHGLQTGCQ